MLRLRLLAVAFATAFVTGAYALPASARPSMGDHQLTTPHFDVHYNTDVSDGTPGADYATQTDAGDIASYAEEAYETYVSWGYTPPPVIAPPTGSGLIDIYVEDLSTLGLASVANPDNLTQTGSTAYFELASPAQLDGFATTAGITPTQEEQQVVAQNVFYMFELGQWVPTSAGNLDAGDLWLFYGPATWASYDAITFQPPTLALGDPDIALDCSETINDGAHDMCDPDFYTGTGMARWGFFELLASKYGKSFFNSIIANGAAGESGTTALSNALTAKGTTLAGVYTDFVNRYMSGTIGPAALEGARPTAYSGVSTGISAVTTATTAAVVPVDHLSARYVTFDRGDSDGSHTCYAATLTVNVSLQYGAASQSFSSISSQPYFFWDVSGSSPQALSVNGNSASITVPWDTCDWNGTHGWLSLPNASTSVDGATFTVSYTTTVDTNTPAAASSAPDQTSIWGTSVPVPTTDVAPTIDVFGPAVLKLSATSRVIRLIINSSDVGSVNATLGSTKLGTGALRAGNNDVRFTVPASLVNALRRAAAANLLTLTPMSPSGATAGTPVTRHVTIATPVKAKPKPKKPKK